MQTLQQKDLLIYMVTGTPLAYLASRAPHGNPQSLPTELQAHALPLHPLKYADGNLQHVNNSGSYLQALVTLHGSSPDFGGEPDPNTQFIAQGGPALLNCSILQKTFMLKMIFTTVTIILYLCAGEMCLV